MLHISCLPLGAYQTNCYIVWGEDSKTCAVIDPGYQPELVLDEIHRLGLAIEAILLTHGHFDHVGAVRDLCAETDCAVYIHPADLSLPTAFTAGPLHYTHTYGERDVLQVAGLCLTVLHTPGHTPGCVCLQTENALFCGDTLFAGSCGRTDLPGGDTATLRQSLQRLRTLSDGLAIYPGHGGSSTLGQEKCYNPYL